MDDDEYWGSSDGESYIDDEEEETTPDELNQRVRGGDLVVANRNSYVVLTEQEILQRLSQEAAATAEVFSVPVDWALALLGHYRWNPIRLQDDWFSDQQDRVRDAVGLGDIAAAAGSFFSSGAGGDEEIITCGICMDDKPAAEMASAGCAHRYCHDCWRGYVATAVRDVGTGGLALRCPDESCSRAVLWGMVERFATAAGCRDAYDRHLARAYVEARGRWMKPCTALGCGCAIEIVPRLKEDGGGDLLCRCGDGFCWRYGGAPHWPASCAAVARWAREADEATADWILLHTKACPRCRRRVERVGVGGCRYMRCAAPCFHRFCWLCLGPTLTATGDWSSDHDFCGDSQEPAAAEELRRARKALDRFLYNQDLYLHNMRRRNNAERELRRLRDEQPPLAGEDVEVVAEAWEEVAEGRRVLANACAYGQSLRGETSTRRRELFEYQLAEANAVLERLQQRAEEAAAEKDDYSLKFGAELAALTKVTRHCVENFAKAVEEGLPEVSAPDYKGILSWTTKFDISTSSHNARPVS